MNWIDEANKELEEQRAKFQESIDSGKAAKRGMAEGARSQIRQGNHNFQKSSGKRKPQKPKTAEHQFACSSAGGKAKKGIKAPHAKIEAKKLDVEWNCKHCNTPGRGIGNFKRYGHDTGLCTSNEYFPRKSTVKEWKLIYDLIPNNINISDKEIFKIVQDAYPKIKWSAINTFIEYSSNLILVKEGIKRSPINRPIYKKIETNKNS